MLEVLFAEEHSLLNLVETDVLLYNTVHVVHLSALLIVFSTIQVQHCYLLER